MTKWRMSSPQTLIGSGYASNKALAYFANVLDHHLATAKPQIPAAPFPPEGAVGDGGAMPGPAGRPVAPTTGSYLHQILLPQYPKTDIANW